MNFVKPTFVFQCKECFRIVAEHCDILRCGPRHTVVCALSVGVTQSEPRTDTYEDGNGETHLVRKADILCACKAVLGDVFVSVPAAVQVERHAPVLNNAALSRYYYGSAEADRNKNNDNSVMDLLRAYADGWQRVEDVHTLEERQERMEFVLNRVHDDVLMAIRFIVQVIRDHSDPEPLECLKLDELGADTAGASRHRNADAEASAIRTPTRKRTRSAKARSAEKRRRIETGNDERRSSRRERRRRVVQYSDEEDEVEEEEAAAETDEEEEEEEEVDDHSDVTTSTKAPTVRRSSRARTPTYRSTSIRMDESVVDFSDDEADFGHIRSRLGIDAPSATTDKVAAKETSTAASTPTRANAAQTSTSTAPATATSTSTKVSSDVSTQCDVCGQKFSTADERMAHITNEHAFLLGYM